MIQRSLLLGAVLLLAAGCASAPPRTTVAPPASPVVDSLGLAAPYVRALVARAQAVRTLRGRAEMALSAADWEGSTLAEAAILAEAPGRLRLRAYAGPITALDLVARDERFWAYVPDRHEVWSGPAEALERRLGFPVRADDLVAILLGRPFGAPDAARLVSLDADRAVLAWEASRGGTVRVTVRRLDGAAIVYEWARDGRTLAVLKADDFLREPSGLWPRRLSLRWTEPEASLRLVFHDQQLNRDLPAGAFEPLAPPGVAQVELSTEPDSGSAWERVR
jgi:hypothetical protein